MKITVNGKATEVAAEMDLRSFILSSNINHRQVIIVLNDRVVKNDSWAETALREGDSVELVSFVGGG